MGAGAPSKGLEYRQDGTKRAEGEQYDLNAYRPDGTKREGYEKWLGPAGSFLELAKDPDLLLSKEGMSGKLTKKQKAEAAIQAEMDALKKENEDILKNTPDLMDEAVNKARRPGLKGQGRSSTFLTGSSGIAPASVPRKTLLGG